MNVENWEHTRGYHLNADGKSIEYEHINRDLLAIVEGMVNEDPNTDIDFEFYTVIFDNSSGKPYERIEGHNFFGDKESAKENLKELMEKHS